MAGKGSLNEEKELRNDLGATRKDKKKAAQSRAIKDGTYIEKEASGKPKKPPPPTTVCMMCKKEFINVEKDRVQLKAHADSKHPKNKYDECFSLPQ